MSANPHVNSIFSEFQKTLDEEQEIREAIRTICKDVDQISREITTVLQVIHHSEESSSPLYIPNKIPRSCKALVPPWWDNECEVVKITRKTVEKIYNKNMREEIFLTYKLIDTLAKGLFEQKKLKSWCQYCASLSPVMQACMKARELFEKARDGYRKLKDTVPPTDYYKYQDHWRFMTQRYCFLISLVIWIEKGILAKHETVAEVLGVSAVEEKCGFHLDVEDYLVGLLILCTELSRLAVNSVTRGDYNRPVQISKFVMELNAGFRLLNLKNDHLRKRFDALKYDVKKIEEVVYDLSIRGLLPKTEEPVQK